MRLRLFAWCWLFLWMTLALESGEGFAGGIRTTGPLPEGKLAALSAEGAIAIETPTGRISLAATELVVWGEYQEPRLGPIILLSDGSWLAAHPIALTADELRVDSRLFGELPLPRSAVRGVIFRLPGDPSERDRLWDWMEARRERGDMLLLANGDELTGQATGQKYDADTNTEQLLFRVPGGAEPAALPLDKLTSVAFDAVLATAAAPRGIHYLAGLRDGSKLVVASVAIKGNRQELQLPCGVVLPMSRDDLGEDLIYWQPLGAGVVYLSDLRDAGYKHIPFLTQTWPFFNDRNCHGHRLRTGDALYFKGLGMHSTSRLAYELDGEYRALAAELALDRSAGARGSVIFRVFTAGGGSGWKVAYESPIVRGGDPPLPMTVDLRGVERLSLIVDFAERGDECDDANWLNARLVK